MAKKVDFINALEDEIEGSKEPKVKELEREGETKFKVEKKKIQKTNKKTFPLYMEQDLAKELDRVCRKTGYNRNEMVNKMIKFCIENIELN